MKSSARFHCASFKLSMSVATRVVLSSPATSLTESISSSLIATVGIPHYTDGLAEALGDKLGDAEDDPEALGLSDGDTLGDTDGDADELGDAECDGLADWLTVVAVTNCHNPSASTIETPPAVRIQMEPLP